MAFATRPALARVRVNGASTTRFGNRHSPTSRGSSKVGIGVHRFPEMRQRTRRAGLRQPKPQAAHASHGYTAATGPTLHTRQKKGTLHTHRIETGLGATSIEFLRADGWVLIFAVREEFLLLLLSRR